MSFVIEHAPTIGTVFFFTAFVWIAFKAYHPRNKEKLQNHAFIPLKEEPRND
jgi:cbb3-type cytochrome oxidase subunit 3